MCVLLTAVSVRGYVGPSYGKAGARRVKNSEYGRLQFRTNTRPVSIIVKTNVRRGATPRARTYMSTPPDLPASVIGAGALVLDRIMTLGGYDEVVASEHDILDGIALSLA